MLCTAACLWGHRGTCSSQFSPTLWLSHVRLGSSALAANASFLASEIFLKKCLFILCVCEPACVHVHHTHACACGGQKMVWDPLELELQEVVSSLTWIGNWALGPLQAQPVFLVRAAPSPLPLPLAIPAVVTVSRALLAGGARSHSSSYRLQNPCFVHSSMLSVLYFLP